MSYRATSCHRSLAGCSLAVTDMHTSESDLQPCTPTQALAGIFHVPCGFRLRGSVSCLAGITCPHGRLAPEGRSGARRFAVSPETWAMLRRLWPQQVLMEAQARRDKAARAAAKRAATGGLDVAAVADISKGEAVLGLLTAVGVLANMHSEHSVCVPTGRNISIGAQQLGLTCAGCLQHPQVDRCDCVV